MKVKTAATKRTFQFFSWMPAAEDIAELCSDLFKLARSTGDQFTGKSQVVFHFWPPTLRHVTDLLRKICQTSCRRDLKGLFSIEVSGQMLGFIIATTKRGNAMLSAE